MQKFKVIIDFILFSNIFVAFAVACLAFQTFYLIHSVPDYFLLLFIFCSTTFTYLFHHSFKLINTPKGEELPVHLEWIRSHKKHMVLIFTIMIPLLLFCSFNFSVSLFISLIPMGILALGYSIPVIPGSGQNIGLREIPGLKIFLIAFLVSCVTVFLPVISTNGEVNFKDSEILFIFFQRFFFLFAVCLPFDIRDMAYDIIKGTKTLPVLLGEKKSKMMAFASLLFCLAFSILHVSAGDLQLAHASGIFVSLLISAVILMKVSQKSSAYYFSFIVECLLILQTLLVVKFGWIGRIF